MLKPHAECSSPVQSCTSPGPRVHGALSGTHTESKLPHIRLCHHEPCSRALASNPKPSNGVGLPQSTPRANTKSHGVPQAIMPYGAPMYMIHGVITAPVQAPPLAMRLLHGTAHSPASCTVQPEATAVATSNQNATSHKWKHTAAWIAVTASHSSSPPPSQQPCLAQSSHQA